MAEADPTPPWAMKRKASLLEQPLMKRQAKAATPSTMPKAPIAKVPPNGKAPVAKMPPKAPIAKRPPISGSGDASPAPAAAPPSAAAAVSPAFAKRPPPPIPAQGAGASMSKASGASPSSPPASPSPEASPPSRGASWAEFADTDPVYALIGELGDKKVAPDGETLDEERLAEYMERLTKPGVCKTPKGKDFGKDWIEVWAAMNIPVTMTCHSLVVQSIVEIGVRSEVGETIGQVLAELVKGHRAKVKAVEHALITIFECGNDEQECITGFLLHIFPKSPTTEWGWSRVGWSWKEWWGIAEKILNVLEPSAAFEALRSLLSQIETDSGAYLPHQQIWDEKRLTLMRAALCRYGSLQEDELAAAVDISLS